MSLHIVTINHNLLMQDILSLIDKEEEESKWTITKLENDDGQRWQIHTAYFMPKDVRQCPCPGCCLSLVLGQFNLPPTHENWAYRFNILLSIWHLLMIKALKPWRMRLQLNCLIHSTTLLPTPCLRTPQCCLYIKVFQKWLNSSVPIQAVGLYAEITEDMPMTFAR